MDKGSFKPNTRYTITWRDPHATLRPANIYVYRVYDPFMIARMIGGDGLLRKIAYEDVVKIVREQPVPPQDQFCIPAAVLDEKAWRECSVIERYSSSPHMGK